MPKKLFSAAMTAALLFQGTALPVLTAGQSETYPAGYTFDQDSFGFANYQSEIEEKYFTTLFEPGVGRQLQKSHPEAGNGLCYGMAMTTAAIYNGFPQVQTFRTPQGQPVGHIRDLQKSWQIATADGGLWLSLNDLIVYNHLYQMSMSAHKDLNAGYNDITKVKKAVEDKTAAGQIGVILCIRHYEKDEAGKYILDASGALKMTSHAVLAVGVAEDGILVNDSNYDGATVSTKVEKITIGADGSWSYSNPWDANGITSANSEIGFVTDFSTPWKVLTSSAPASASYADRRVDGRSSLLSVNTNGTYDRPSNSFATSSIIGAGESVQNTKEDVYWIQNSDEFTVTNVRGSDSTLSFANENLILSYAGGPASTVSGRITPEGSILTAVPAQASAVHVSLQEVSPAGSDTTIKVASETPTSDVNLSVKDGVITVKGVDKAVVSAWKDNVKTAEVKVTDADRSFRVDYTQSHMGTMPVYEADTTSEGPEVTDLSAGTIEDLPEVLTWTGEALTPDFVVSFEGKVLTKDKDYTVSYVNNTDPGLAAVTVTGTGSYTGSITKTFKIMKEEAPRVDLSTAKETNIQPEYEWTGSEITPEPTVFLGDKTLEKDKDYRLLYANNTDPGEASVTIIGTGDYSGSLIVRFKIVKAPQQHPNAPGDNNPKPSEPQKPTSGNNGSTTDNTDKNSKDNKNSGNTDKNKTNTTDKNKTTKTDTKKKSTSSKSAKTAAAVSAAFYSLSAAAALAGFGWLKKNRSSRED